MTRTNRQSALDDVRRQIHALRIHEANELYSILCCVRSAVDSNSTDQRLKAWCEPLDGALCSMDDDMADDAPEEGLPGSFSEPVELDARTQRSYP